MSISRLVAACNRLLPTGLFSTMESMSEPVISIKHLNKTYKNGFQALKDINLEIRKGEIFGLLGPNGAGKTTLINIVSGLVKITSGEVRVMGKDVERDYRFTR